MKKRFSSALAHLKLLNTFLDIVKQNLAIGHDFDR